MSRREVPAIVVGCGIELETAPAEPSVDAGSVVGSSGDAGRREPDAEAGCQELTLSGALCADSHVRCVGTETVGEQVRLPIGSIAGKTVGGCKDRFRVRAGHIQIQPALPAAFRIDIKLQFAANQSGLFVLGVGGDPPEQLGAGTCGTLAPGESAIAFWGECRDGGPCGWTLAAGTQGECNIPDVPSLTAMPTPTTLEVRLRLERGVLRAALTTTPDGGVASTIDMLVPTTALDRGARGSLMYYAYDDKPTSDRAVTVDSIAQACAAEAAP